MMPSRPATAFIRGEREKHRTGDVDPWEHSF